ncbi:putative serine protease EDA2 [Vitis vinifera]|uniref:Putative serine protease EDA2 n=1 Tax=Vitis vinifera TaxID=29760 RepID=A0A438EVQ4_VITVI|nr:putative serine protease EDA2 [Vitis vinifera]
MNTRQPNTSFFVLLTIILRLSSKYDHKIATFVLYLVDVQAEGCVSDKHEIRLLEMEKRHSKIKKSYWAYLDHLCRKGTNSRGRGSAEDVWRLGNCEDKAPRKLRLVLNRTIRELRDMRLVLILTTFSLLCLASDGAITSRLLQRNSHSSNFLTTDELWFNQTVDHFSPLDHSKFPQRYYEFTDYFRLPDGPIFLKICGEASCDGIPNDYISVLAKKFGAAVVSLEHRYYGKSSPFRSLRTENLKYLSSKQALFDLAVFRQYYQASFLLITIYAIKIYNVHKIMDQGEQLVKIDSAWFRLKFPHLTCGSLASSAVVLAIYNFTEFDRQIGESAGAECKAVLQEVNGLVEQRLAVDGNAVKSLFGAASLKIDADFLYLLADAAVTAFQYGNPDMLCSPLVQAKKDGEDLVNAYATYVKEYYLGTFGVSIETYNQQHLKRTNSAGDTSDRLWWFQVCTEVAFFQVAPSDDSMRSSEINTKYHLDLCKNVFGNGIYPDVDATNIYYGGTKIAGSNIDLFTFTVCLPSLFLVINCGHGTDLRGCPQSPLSPEGDAKNCSSPDAVHKVRQQIIEHIDLWLSQCQATGRSYM